MNENQPIIIGVGQTVDHWDGVDAQEAPSPLGLITQASRNALADTGIDDLAAQIDTIAIVRLFSDSLPTPFLPFGRVDNYPEAVAKNLSANPSIKIYSTAGGEQPQSLVNELAGRLSKGESRVGLIAGGEATGALKMAMKNRHRLDWSCKGSGNFDGFDDRGPQTDFISEYELNNGLGMPPQTYGCLETALRNRLGLSKGEYLQIISQMFANLSEVALNNPYSQFPEKRSAEFLSTASKENYPIVEPYLKWHVAQDAVNQGASLIMTTVGFAKELKVDPDKWVFLHGHAEVKDRLVSERPDLSRSLALELAIDESLKASNLSATDVNHHDIYSCFPIVPYLGAEILGLNPIQSTLTVTGGLPFFGGPGNNYSTHAIASMVGRLRSEPDEYGMVVANGGFLSKEAVGVYSVRPPKNWQPFQPEKTQQAISRQEPVTLLSRNGEATITAYGIRYSRVGVDHCYVVAENDHGRYFATVDPDHKATMSSLGKADELLGKIMCINGKSVGNTIVNTNQLPCFDTQKAGELKGESMSTLFLSNSYKYVNVERNGRVLEVTLNRPESYNALFSEAHFELAEIFDAYEQDKELWVAIISGSGEKAFCSGNDLKVTANGGDMSLPTSGFAGLCSRLNREKPIIAAVNGVAFGGGLEIVLAVDLAVAEPHAKFALPEVKVGLFAGAGGLQRITKQIGQKAAMELILTGRAISAQEAKNLGIINCVTDDGSSALDHARQLASTIVVNSPSAIRASKRILNGVYRIDDFAETLELNMPEFRKLLQSKDTHEGVSAFAEKRKPNWVNE